MSSDMQYTQRKSHRSVTETRRYVIARPNGSTSGKASAGGVGDPHMVGTILSIGGSCLAPTLDHRQVASIHEHPTGQYR